MTEETYTVECHVDECETEFIDVTSGEYVEHLLSEHVIPTADEVIEMVIDELKSKEQARSLDNTTFFAIPGNEVPEKPTDEPNSKLDSIIAQHDEFEAIDGNDAAEQLGITLTEFGELVENDPRFEFGTSPRFPWVNLEFYRAFYDHGEEGHREYYE